MDSLKNLLNYYHNNKLKNQVEAGLIIEFVNGAIKEIWGEKVQSKIKAVSFVNGNLKIRVMNSLLAQEVKFKTKRINDLVNQKFSVKLRQIQVVQNLVENSDNLY